MSDPNLDQRVRDGELTPEQADDAIEAYYEKLHDKDIDRKAEQQEKKSWDTTQNTI